MSAARPERLALVHDYLLVLRGAERTFAALTDIWPESPIVTLLFDDQGTAGRFADRSVRTSPLQRLRPGQDAFRRLMPLYGAAAQRLPTEAFDCIVSSSSAFAHGVPKAEGATHVCYCHSPFRYAWHEQSRALLEVPRPLRPLLGLLLRRHRTFDRRAVRSVDLFVANSQLTRRRIAEFWGRDAIVVHPPVEIDRFSLSVPEEYVLFVGELVRHKRVELAIEAARDARRPIKIVGAGPDFARLRSRYPEALFLGRVSDRDLAMLYAKAAALVVPNVEEFGIAAVEAQAAGRPVVAIGAGGALETVVHGRTGLLVDPREPAELARALRQDLHAFEPGEIRAHAEKFSPEAFRRRMESIVTATWEQDAPIRARIRGRLPPRPRSPAPAGERAPSRVVPTPDVGDDGRRSCPPLQTRAGRPASCAASCRTGVC